MTKFVFVTGGVVSSLGKGIAAASLAAILASRGIRVTDYSCGIADDDRKCRHITSDNRACSHHSLAADSDARKEHGSTADGRAAFDDRSRETRWSLFAARKWIIRERRVRADEYVVAQLDAVPELNTRFHGYPVTYDDVILNKYVIADIYTRADDRAGKYVSECPDRGVPSDAL